MYKALIVEDETLELEALQAIISSRCPEIAEIQGCDNGDDVLELLETYSPDLILMDIHLGSVNGIELSELILKKLPDTRIIVITAFDQFSYAQKAIKFGLADYLLKPVSASGLLSALEKQIHYLDRQHQDLLERVRQRINLSKLQNNFFSSLTGSVIYNHMNPNTKEILKLFDLPSSHMQVFIIELNLKDYDVTESEDAALKKLIIDSIRNSANSARILYDFMSSCEIVLCTFFENAAESEAFNLLSRIQHVISRDFHIPYRISVSAPCADPFRLPLEYKRALGALQLTDSPLCTCTDLFPPAETPLQIGDMIEELANCLITADEEKLTLRLRHLQRTVSGKLMDFSEAQSNYITIWVETMQEIKARLSLQNQAFSELLLNPVADFIAASRLAALHSCYQKYFDTALNRLRQITSENKNYTVLRAQRYIKAHYPEALTLQSISDALQISPYYLCHIFKCSANTGVMEYLNTCRIEAAKKLLQAENMSVKDVAFRVGFSDPNYFCRVFKRTTSLTPSAFKNLENESSVY